MKFRIGTAEIQRLREAADIPEGPQPQQTAEPAEVPTVYVVPSAEAKEALEQAGIFYDGDIDLKEVGFCKAETQQDCLVGSLYIPKLPDVLNSRYRILLFINRRNIVIVDDSEFSCRLIMRISRRRNRQETAKEKFLYQFMTELMSRDLELLIRYEKRLMRLDDLVQQGKIGEFQAAVMPVRKELLTLKGYYDELADMGKELEENENRFFAKKYLKYFGIVSDRANRLMEKTSYLLTYAQQIRDAYQAQIDSRQNANMQFLTALSSVFFPLTLITGWYGMNFENMPELKNGYPGVILFSIIVLLICILVFKKKKMF